MGMKAMHGSRNVIVIGNQFSKKRPVEYRHDARGCLPRGLPLPCPARMAAAPNVDGGSIIANNIISDFGYGHAHWIWGDDGTPIKFDRGQKPENPPLADVVVQGNVVYDTGTSRRNGTSLPLRGDRPQ